MAHLPIYEVTYTPSRAEAVRQELANILNHGCFKASDRCSKLLRYVVEVGLSDQQHRLKERTIGHEVFGRPPSYETSSDPVVRNAASELRRRLLQYHHETTAKSAVSINLIPGSYTPEFRFTTDEPAALEPEAHVETGSQTPILSLAPVELAATLTPKYRRLLLISLIVCLAIAGIAVVVVRSFSKPTPSSASSVRDDQFWKPLLTSDRDALICISGDPAPPDNKESTEHSNLPFVDAKAYANIAGLLTQSGMNVEVKLANDTNFASLRDRPVILIGGFRNPWTMRLTANARFQIKRDDTRIWIEDSTRPREHAWETDWRRGVDRSTTAAYAIVSRVKDRTTGGIVVSITGLGTLGTEVAANFLAKRSNTKSLPSRLSDPNVNIQIVLKTVVVDGDIGSPQIVATYIW